MFDTCTHGTERARNKTHQFALRIKSQRPDFLSSSDVRIWAEGVPVYARRRGTKVVRDGGHGHHAHDTGERVLGGGDQGGEQQLREIEVTYVEKRSLRTWKVRGQLHLPRTFVPNCPSYPCLVNTSTGGNMIALFGRE